MEASSTPFHLSITADPLDIMPLLDFVADPSVGAISTFVGVTRDNFQGKSVVRLEYEAYIPMAIKKMQVRGTYLAWA